MEKLLKMLNDLLKQSGSKIEFVYQDDGSIRAASTSLDASEIVTLDEFTKANGLTCHIAFEGYEWVTLRITMN